MAVTRADELSTIGATLRRFAQAGSPRVISLLLAGVAAARIVLGGWALVDLIVVAIIAGLVGPVEWVVHRGVLHGRVDSWSARRLGTGVGHRQHHEDPAELVFLLLRPTDAGACALVLVVSVAGLIALIGRLVDHGAPLALGLTGAMVALAALLRYEWTHLLIHTRYRPRSRRYQRLARHHRLHHYRNEDYWLGVTSNLGDRLRSTLPTDRSAVPLSDTARTLS